MIQLIAGIFKESISFFKDKQKAKHEMKLAGIKNRQRLLESEQDYNHEWEMASLENSSQSLKWFSFLMFSAPIITIVILPEYGARIFTNLKLAPEWFVKIWITINGAVWGIAALKDSGVSMKNIFKGKLSNE